ncbi:hypothetical protein [Streptomyces sp. NPDC057909]|uniref:hypothetical protein n=1 Tax=Streptomyces sp. NPDC057909 TaxID=3346277 RepID=UPI0036E3648C
MISDAVVTAVRTLQEQALRIRDSYELDRIERALDELLRNPAGSTPAAYRSRSALGHAYETLERRKAIAPQTELEVSGQEPGYDEGAFHEIEMMAWLCVEPGFKERDRKLLIDLALGHDTETLAERDGISVVRLREHVSRCRKRARELKPNLDLVA